MDLRNITLSPDEPFKGQTPEFKTAPGKIRATGMNSELAEFTINGKKHEFNLHFTRPIPRFDVSNATLRYRPDDKLSGHNIAFNGSVTNPEDRRYDKAQFEAILANGVVMDGTLDKAWNMARTVYGVGEWKEVPEE